MKKFFVAILAFLYISTSSGATIHMHYCMGKLADWGLGQHESKICGKCGMGMATNKNGGCCNDEQQFLKNVSDQQVSESVFTGIQLLAVELPPSFIGLPFKNYSTVTTNNPVIYTPPNSSGLAVYIRNCVFRI